MLSAGQIRMMVAAANQSMQQADETLRLAMQKADMAMQAYRETSEKLIETFPAIRDMTYAEESARNALVQSATAQMEADSYAVIL